ncbi:hypothetical protein F5B22DRAFT_619752 [Xylaria bambusicola]|uniref:uncharacterized protein n=1 Tax=Xylaria bambusicola TaxID=326684 RepID=UPI0020073142|nr:uncharacterized protein F5B22DRAFT_619752 [Xylaria bambusicola]KAI0508627.1 hypothetical protein F5B22DRAFT_619752 [Xylaria bambusicola]
MIPAATQVLSLHGCSGYSAIILVVIANGMTAESAVLHGKWSNLGTLAHTSLLCFTCSSQLLPVHVWKATMRP